MSNRAAYRLLAVLMVVGIPIELVLQYGPAKDEKFTRFSEVWHPYYLFMLGTVALPILIGYALPLARRLGGRATAYGRTVWFLSMSMLSFMVIGPYLMFAQLTCSMWASCDHPVGWVTNPRFGDIGYLASFPLAVVALVALVHGLGARVHTELVRRWYVPVGVIVLSLVLYVPAAGLDLAFGSGQSGWADVVEILYIVGSGALMTVTLIAAIRLHEMGGGALGWPVRIMLVGTFAMSVGVAARLHTVTGGTTYDVHDPTVAPYTIGLITWVASFLMIGAAIERLLGIGRAPAATS